jgi:hypothetical protein
MSFQPEELEKYQSIRDEENLLMVIPDLIQQIINLTISSIS